MPTVYHKGPDLQGFWNAFLIFFCDEAMKRSASFPAEEGALIDVDIVEMGIIPVTPEVPHGYV